MEIIKIPKKEGIIDRTTGKVLNRKLRVAAYARVSTMGAEQLNSYESQKKYYYEKINNNPEWQYVDIYADEGISGTTDYRRASFMKMIQALPYTLSPQISTLQQDLEEIQWMF